MSKTPLLDFLKVGLENTDSGLGDRSLYVGSSDVGQCPKKSFLSKTVGESHDLKQLLIFERGHVAEGIVRNGLANNPQKVKFTEQFEAIGVGEIDFIKTHIDFVVEFPQELLVIECKTFSTPLPNGNPRESWIYQVQLQLGLLKAMTGKDVRGKILAFNLNTGLAHEFDIYFNRSLFHIAVERATHLWESLKANVEPKGECGDLCSVCPFKDRCETLRGVNPHALPEDITAGLDELDTLKQYVKKEKEVKENIKAFFEASGLKKGVSKDKTVTYSTRKGRETVDILKLKEIAPDILPLVLKDGEEYGILKIN